MLCCDLKYSQLWWLKYQAVPVVLHLHVLYGSGQTQLL